MKEMWYVGDPCYVVNDSDWSVFCETLWKNENHKIRDEPCSFMWKGHNVQVFSSPGGDGCWTFSSGEIGVDAGIISIMPLEATDKTIEVCRNMGIVFDYEPTLEVSSDDYYVILNSEYNYGVAECEHCSFIGECVACSCGSCEVCTDCKYDNACPECAKELAEQEEANKED